MGAFIAAHRSRVAGVRACLMLVLSLAVWEGLRVVGTEKEATHVTRENRRASLAGKGKGTSSSDLGAVVVVAIGRLLSFFRTSFRNFHILPS